MEGTEYREIANLSGQVRLWSIRAVFNGQYSSVYHGQLGHELVAVKVLKEIQGADAHTMRRKLYRERTVWGRLRHPNVLPLYGFADDHELFQPFGALISPWRAQGNAYEFLKVKGETMSFYQKLSLWKGVVMGVSYLHNLTPALVHGDLKSANVMIDNNSAPQICDFGLVSILLDESTSGMTTTSPHTGTDRYLAYELLLDEENPNPTLASDVFALGGIGLECIFLQQPYAHRKNNMRGRILADIRAGIPPAKRPEASEPQHQRVWDILDRCWMRNSHERINTRDLIPAVEALEQEISGTLPFSSSGSSPNHAGPPASINPYDTRFGHQPQYRPQMGGLVPDQISSIPGSSRSGGLVHVGQSQQPQVNNQDRAIIKHPISRRRNVNLGLNIFRLPTQPPQGSSGGSQASGQTSPQRPTTKRPVQTIGPPTKKRQRFQALEDVSEEEYQKFHNSSANITPAHRPPNQPLNPSKMMGISAPWDPNNSSIPSYPTYEILAVGYRAYLDSYHPSSAPTVPDPGQLNSSAAPGYRHERSDKTRQDEPWDLSSTDTSPYGTGNRARLGSSGDLIDQNHQHSHHRPKIDSQQQQSLMLAPSHETPSPFKPADLMGNPIASQQHRNVSQDAYPYYSSSGIRMGPGYGNGEQQQLQERSSPALKQNDPQISVGYSHQGEPANANYARPPPSTIPYATHPGYQIQHPLQMSGVAPNQVSLNSGGSRSGMLARVEQRQEPQVNNPGRAILEHLTSRKKNANLGVNTSKMPAQAEVSTIGSQNNGTYGPQLPSRPITKPLARVAKPPSKKRQRAETGDETDSSSDHSGAGQIRKLPGACTPCKRVKMKCNFSKGQNDCCQRCRDFGLASQCVVERRKSSLPSNKMQQLLQKFRSQDTIIKSKDAVIKSLLEQLYNAHISPRDPPSITSGDAIPAHLQNAPHEEKSVDRQILDWIARAQGSIQDTSGFRTGGGLLEEDSSEDSSEFRKGLGGRGTMRPTESDTSDSGRSSELLAAHNATRTHGIEISTKLHSLSFETTPIGLLAELSLADNEGKDREAQSKRPRSGSQSRSTGGAEESDSHTMLGDSSVSGGGDEDDGTIGVASRGYFQPAPTLNMSERKDIPEIMTSGLISPTEVDKLFTIYFDRLNVHVFVLDPVLYTPATTFGRCPFLFTVVCAIASRYYTERPELHNIAMHSARRAAASSLIEAAKSVELCQAYMLMSVYSMPSLRWEDAREWLYLGLALRMATDINLHVKSTTEILNELHEREILNRTRTWLNLYSLDCSTSTQLGRPPFIRPDPIIRSCQAWWKSSPVNGPFDLHLCVYTDLTSSITAEFQELVYWNPGTETTGLRNDLDLVEIAFQYDDKLQAWNAEAAIRFATHSDSSSAQCAYRVQLLPFHVNYHRLVVLSLGFQQAMQTGARNVDPELVKRCLNAACGVIKTVVEDLAPTEYFHFAPDGDFLVSLFASTFLVKMLRPQHANLLNAEQRTCIIDLVELLVGTLKSPGQRKYIIDLVERLAGSLKSSRIADVR